jgi:transposase-like protein
VPAQAARGIVADLALVRESLVIGNNGVAGDHRRAARNWIHLAGGRTPAAAPRAAEASALSGAERAELIELRRRLKQVQMERDILANCPRGLPRPWA